MIVAAAMFGGTLGIVFFIIFFAYAKSVNYVGDITPENRSDMVPRMILVGAVFVVFQIVGILGGILVYNAM